MYTVDRHHGRDLARVDHMSRFTFFVLLALLSPAATAAQGTLSVTVFDDRNGNGARDPDERPLPGVVVSNQRDVAQTDASGVARIERGPTGIVFVSLPGGYRSVGPFWRAPAPTDSTLAFALQPARAPRTFTFVHASDPHIEPKNVDRTRRLRQLVDSIRPDFTIVTGDLIRDAMSQQEPLARTYFELFAEETRGFAKPLWTVPGNHDHFGIIPSRSHVPATHPLYDRGMYRLYRGPDYYSFTYGGIHFVALNTLMTDDSAYYGRVDSLQLEWLRRDLATVAPTVPVVTFNHIPMVRLGAAGRVREHSDGRVVPDGPWRAEGSPHRGERHGGDERDARTPLGARARGPHARRGEARLPDRGSAHALRAGGRRRRAERAR